MLCLLKSLVLDLLFAAIGLAVFILVGLYGFGIFLCAR
jgi:hypothetical protein